VGRSELHHPADQALLDLELAAGDLRLEPEADGPALAERPAEVCAGGGADQERGVTEMVRHDGVREAQQRHPAERGADEPAADDGRHDKPGGLRLQVLGPLLEDVSRLSHSPHVLHRRERRAPLTTP
jgi:hypothetical protein